MAAPLYHIVSKNKDGSKSYLAYELEREWFWVGSSKKSTPLPEHLAKEKVKSVRRKWRVRAKLEEVS